MTKERKILAIGATISALSLLGGCGADSSSGGKTGAGAGFGKCEITSTAGSVQLKLANPQVATVAAILPAPGWYDGTTPDNVNGGFEYCMAAEVANMAGAKSLKVMNVAWDQYISGSAKGYDYAFLGTTITEKRKQVFDFSTPYFQANLAITVKKDAAVTEQNLKEKKIGVLQGNYGADWANKLGLQTRVFQSPNDVVTALQAGQIDAMVQDTPLALTAVSNSGGQLQVVAQVKAEQFYGAVTPKGSANSAGVDKAVKELVKAGTPARLTKTWLVPQWGGIDPSTIPFWQIG